MKIADIRVTTIAVSLDVPLRPGWAPTLPNNRWGDPADDHRPHLNGQSADASTIAALARPLTIGRP